MYLRFGRSISPKKFSYFFLMNLFYTLFLSMITENTVVQTRIRVVHKNVSQGYIVKKFKKSQNLFKKL